MIRMKLLNIAVSYQKKSVIKDVSATLKGGELTSVIGPNGTGKTTLIKAISGLVQHRGCVEVKCDKKEIPKRDIAYVPQMSTTTSTLSVFEMVLLGKVKDLGWKVPKKYIEDTYVMLKELGLLDLSEKAFSSLSGGQRQLVSMAQALISKPKVLLLDEPTSALDLKHQLKVLDVAKEYTKKEGIITIVVLHDLALVARYSDNIVLLNNGFVEAMGNQKEVLKKELVEKVYQAEVDVSTSSMGYTTVTPIRPTETSKLEFSA